MSQVYFCLFYIRGGVLVLISIILGMLARFSRYSVLYTYQWLSRGPGCLFGGEEDYKSPQGWGMNSRLDPPSRGQRPQKTVSGVFIGQKYPYTGIPVLRRVRSL